MKKNLINKELALLSDLLKVDIRFLTQIRGILDARKARQMLIKKEFKDNVQEGKYQKKQIISALMQKYDMSQSGIEHIIYATVSNKEKFCTRCGSAISKYKWTRNNGICDCCVRKEINQNGTKK